MARIESQGRGILSSHGARAAAAGEARGLRHDAPRREPVRRRRELSGPGGRRHSRRHARGKSSTLHVDRVLRTSRDENLRMIAETVAHFKNLGKEVIYDAEHFFDGYRLDPGYTLASIEIGRAHV